MRLAAAVDASLPDVAALQRNPDARLLMAAAHTRLTAPCVLVLLEQCCWNNGEVLLLSL